MSRNFTTEIDTQREYFNCQYFNQTNTTQIAKYETTLLKPFFNDPDKWKLAINRFRVPISSIPLTANNIPVNRWKVGIAYQKNSSGSGLTFDEEVVQQYNQVFDEIYKFYCLFSDNTITTYSNINPFQNQTGYENLLNSAIYPPNVNLMPCFENKYNPIMYYIGTNNGVYGYDLSTNLIVMDKSSLINGFPSAIACDKATGNFYVSVTSPSITTSIYIFTRISETTYSPPLIVNMPVAGVSNEGLAVYNNYLVCSYAQSAAANLLIVLNATTGALVNSQSSSKALTNIAFSPVNNILYLTSANDNSITTYNISGLGVLSLLYTGPSPFQISYPVMINGFDQNDNVLLNNFANNVIVSSQVSAVNKFGVVQYNLTFPKPLFGLTFIDEGLQPVESGPYSIFTLQDYLNKINAAFATAYNAAKTAVGSGFIPTQPPEIVYNSTSRLFSLTCEGQYLTQNPDLSNQYIIYMNDALYNQFFFPSNDYKIGFKSIIVQNYGFNAVEGNGSITLPQFINIYQETSTIYSFNDLTRIIVGTLSIPVSGDGDGTHFTNDNTTNNKTINQITDILPDTTLQTNFEPIIYIPAGILRWYNLYAQQPFTKIDLIFYYETKDGVLRPLLIPAGEYFSCKLEFKKGQGDF